MSPLVPDTMTKDERSCLLYAESCAVDGGGLMEGIRMNHEDHEALKRFGELGLLEFHRIPASILGSGAKSSWTHIVTLSPDGWELAAMCRRRRARQRGPHATEALAILAERNVRSEATITGDAVSVEGEARNEGISQ